MPQLIVDAGELTGSLRQGAEQRIFASLPQGHTDGRAVRVGRITIEYELYEPAPGSIPNIDPWRGYEQVPDQFAEPNGEGAHPHDDATGHVERTHEDFGPRLTKEHSAPRDITMSPSWGQVGC